jgi:hypothetical protein
MASPSVIYRAFNQGYVGALYERQKYNGYAEDWSVRTPTQKFSAEVYSISGGFSSSYATKTTEAQATNSLTQSEFPGVAIVL